MMNDTEHDDDVDQLYRQKEDQYRELNPRQHPVDGMFIIDCPGECGEPMVLGEGWKGCSIPECPDCNTSADTWSTDPRITEEIAQNLSDGQEDVTELVRG